MISMGMVAVVRRSHVELARALKKIGWTFKHGLDKEAAHVAHLRQLPTWFRG